MTHPYRIKDVMNTKVYSVKVTDDFAKVEDLMHTYKVRHVPVVNETGQVVGLVSQRDLFRISKPRITEEGYVYNPAELNEFVLKHVMTAGPYIAKLDEPLAPALNIMAQNRYGCIPVVNSDLQLLGIITESDILHFVVNKLL